MNAPTIWEIDARPREGLEYYAERERPLLGGFRSVRPKATDFTSNDVISFNSLRTRNPLAPSEGDVKITEDAISHPRIWTQLDLAGEYVVPTVEWPIGRNTWLTDWHETPSMQAGHGIENIVQLLERRLDSTATSVTMAGSYGQRNDGLTYNANEIFHGWKLLEGALRRATVLVLFSGVNPDPIPSETLRALERIKELPDNWDGDGASRIDKKTVAKAEELIREAFLASPKGLKPPSVAPAFGGMIVAEWSGPGGRELILDIPAGDESPGFLLVEHSPEGKELETDDELGPAWSMQDLIARLTGD